MNDEERNREYRERGDVHRHCYAYHHAELPQAERSSDLHDLHDELWWAAKVNEAGDRKLADLLRRAQARIAALETLCKALKNVKVCENEDRGDSNANR